MYHIIYKQYTYKAYKIKTYNIYNNIADYDY